jgi:hypothetical protein
MALGFIAYTIGPAGGASAPVNQWTSCGAWGGPVTTLAIDPLTPTTLYVGTYYSYYVDRTTRTAYRVYKSTNGGATWTAMNTGPGNVSVRTLAIDPVSTNKLYAGTGGGGVYYYISSSITSIAADIKANGSDSSVTVFPQDTLSITVALDNAGSTDNADWWLAVNTTPSGLSFFTFSGWTHTLQPAYQGPLFHLLSFEVVRMPASVLPAGTYTFYFGVDTVMDGKITMGNAYYDSVQVNVVK